MATSTYGTPYVQGSDLVSAYPTVSSSLATRVDEVSYRGNGLNAQTGTTYTLVVGDAGKTITLSNASAVAVTLPQDSVATLPTGAVVTFYNLGAGAVTISQGTGATLQGGSITLAQYDVTSVIKLSANTYGLFDSSRTGLSMVPPTSIANSGGSASLDNNTVTFTTVSSVSLNGVFSSAFTQYRMLIRTTAVSGTNIDVLCRLRLAGTDAATSTTYQTQIITATGTSITTAVGGVTTAVYVGLSSTTTANYYGSATDIYGPFVAAPTLFTIQSQDYSSTAQYNYLRSAYHNQSTAYDGITILPSTGTMSGTVSIFGYRK